MVKRTSSGRARGTADAEPAIAELVHLTQALGKIVAAVYGPEMLLTDSEALEIAEPLGRIVSRYAGATERLRELSDPVLVTGAIAAVAWPRVARVLFGRRIPAPPAPAAPAEATREVTFSETTTVREQTPPAAPRPSSDSEAIYRTIRRIQSV